MTASREGLWEWARAVVDRHRTMRDERPESHNRKNLAEAYIDQAINGPDGRFG